MSAQRLSTARGRRKVLRPLARAASVALGVLALALSACAPVAGVVAEIIENSDGATLSYVSGGLSFDPGEPGVALGVIVRVDGDDLAILSVPEGGECRMAEEQIDCRLGDVSAPVMIGVSGGNVIANATWRRTGANKLYLTFAHLPGGE